MIMLIMQWTKNCGYMADKLVLVSKAAARGSFFPLIFFPFWLKRGMDEVGMGFWVEWIELANFCSSLTKYQVDFLRKSQSL